jgi:hypothetical protein
MGRLGANLSQHAAGRHTTCGSQPEAIQADRATTVRVHYSNPCSEPALDSLTDIRLVQAIGSRGRINKIALTGV